MLQLEATVHWETTEEGGLTTRAFSGIRPSFSVQGDLITCSVHRRDGDKEILLGHDYNVLLKLPYGERYGEFITPGMRFTLNTGRRVVGTGVVEAVLR